MLYDIPDYLADKVHDANQGRRETWLAELDTIFHQTRRPPEHPRLDDNQPTLIDVADATAPHCTCGSPDDRSTRHNYSGQPCHHHGRMDV